jgi:hypothetical protein
MSKIALKTGKRHFGHVLKYPKNGQKAFWSCLKKAKNGQKPFRSLGIKMPNLAPYSLKKPLFDRKIRILKSDTFLEIFESQKKQRGCLCKLLGNASQKTT